MSIEGDDGASEIHFNGQGGISAKHLKAAVAMLRPRQSRPDLMSLLAAESLLASQCQHAGVDSSL